MNRMLDPQDAIRDIMTRKVVELFDFKLKLIDCEIAEGWYYFHAETLWFRENMPAPHINETGRKFACEGLSRILRVRYGDIGMDSPAAYREGVSCLGSEPSNYKNFLDVSELDIFGRNPTDAWLDDLLERIVHEYVETRSRHPIHEMAKNKIIWLVESGRWAFRTSPFHIVQNEGMPIERNPEKDLKEDSRYWSAFYKIISVNLIIQNDSPDLVLRLMGEIGQDFHFDIKMSSKTRLVFKGKIFFDFVWAITFEKSGDYFNQVPKLLLLKSSEGAKWSNDTVVFQDVLSRFHDFYAYADRSMEIFLLYVLPRYRRLIGFYEDCIGADLFQSTLAINTEKN